MYRSFTNLLRQTEAEQRATLAGINLFFSALLGALLGSVATMPIRDFVTLTMLLAGSVAMLFFLVASRRRLLAIGLLAAYAAVLVAMLLQPETRPAGMDDDYDRLVVALAIWLGSVIFVKLIPPLRDPHGAPPAQEDPET